LGQLGIGGASNTTASNVTVPVIVGSLADIKSISAGGFHTIALKQDGTVWTWGYNAYGELGSAEVSSKGSSVPIKVSELSNVKAVSSGVHHCVALKKDNSVWVWGSNFYSQLGNGTTKNNSSTPVLVSGVSGVMGIIGKANHTMALMPNNTVLAWGDNGSGRWGNGIAMSGSAVPVVMSGYNELTAVAAVADTRTLSRQDRLALAGAGSRMVMLASLND
jgi:alpha-tubulin suppressor-like RCC1 family protein